MKQNTKNTHILYIDKLPKNLKVTLHYLQILELSETKNLKFKQKTQIVNFYNKNYSSHFDRMSIFRESFSGIQKVWNDELCLHCGTGKNKSTAPP